MKKKINLQLFAFESGVTAGTPVVQPVNVTTQQSMSPTMKTFYDTTLLENAREEMVFTQFADTQSMKGNKVEWRKYNTFAPALTPLTEGVIPTGKTFGMTKIEAPTTQHGDYVSISDRLEMEAFDDVIYGASEEMGAVSGETYDLLTRNNIIGGNSVAYCPNGNTTITSRKDIDENCILTPAFVHRVATWLKKNKAPRIKGSYVGLIHPSVAHDLTETDAWKEYHKYNDVTPIFKGEIGMLHGVRFVESNACKVWRGSDLTGASKTLSVKTALTVAGKVIAVNEAITADEATALVSREVVINGNTYTIFSATAGAAGAATITMTEDVATADATANAVINPGDGGKDGCAVYATLFMGAKAYGVLDPEGESMEMIIKPKEQIGGPLNQFSTIGYKFCHGAKILYQERLLRVESGSSFSLEDEGN